MGLLALVAVFFACNSGFCVLQTALIEVPLCMSSLRNRGKGLRFIRSALQDTEKKKGNMS